MARPSATTTSSRTSPRGSGPARICRRCSTRSRSRSRTFSLPSVATNDDAMNLTLHVWRQAGPREKGKLVTYAASDISPDMSFLEMLDVVNERLTSKGDAPIAFDHDCREGICGSCGLMINGV